MVNLKISKILAGLVLAATALAVQAQGHSIHEKAATIKADAKDAMTTGKVNAALGTEKNLKSTDIKVNTNHGKVSLTGSTASVNEKERAKKVAEEVSGVEKVEENLKIVPNKK